MTKYDFIIHCRGALLCPLMLAFVEIITLVVAIVYINKAKKKAEYTEPIAKTSINSN